MESWPRPFASGMKSKFQLAPPLLSRAQGIQADESAMAVGASLVAVLVSRGRLGRLVHTHISGWDSSVLGEPVFGFFYCEYCTMAVKMLVRMQISLERSLFRSEEVV